MRRSGIRGLTGLLALGVAALSACGGDGRPGTPPVHAMLVTIDGLRADRVGAYGYPRPTTGARDHGPDAVDHSIDGLAASGVVFERCFAPSADASVSRAALLARDDGIAAAFGANGFRTAAFVTAGAGDAANAAGFAHVTDATTEEDPDYAAVRGAVTWLREVGEPSGEPLFVWLHLSGPAAPWEPAPLGQDDFAARFTDPDYAGELDGSAATLAALRDPAMPLDGLGATHIANLYDAEVARTARLVEQFATTLAGRFDVLPRDLLADSAFVLAGTRGVELFQHGREAEDPTSLYAASLHVPLLVRHPKSLTGRRVFGELVELADVATTLRDWFGLAGAEPARSLLAVTDEQPAHAFEPRPLVRRAGGRASVRTRGYHLLVEGDSARLFDTDADPLERIDVAAREPDRVAELRRVLDEAP